MLIEKGVGTSIMAVEFRHYSDFEIHVVVEGQCTRIFTNKLLLAGFSPVLKIALDAEFSIRKRKKEKTKKKKKKQREEKGPERSCPHANCIAVSPCALYSETTLNTFFNCLWKFYFSRNWDMADVDEDNICEWIYLIQQYEIKSMMPYVNDFLYNLVYYHQTVVPLSKWIRLIRTLDTFQERRAITWILSELGRTWWDNFSELDGTSTFVEDMLRVWECKDSDNLRCFVKIIARDRNRVLIRYVGWSKHWNVWKNFSELQLPTGGKYRRGVQLTCQHEFDFYQEQFLNITEEKEGQKIHV